MENIYDFLVFIYVEFLNVLLVPRIQSMSTLFCSFDASCIFRHALFCPRFHIDWVKINTFEECTLSVIIKPNQQVKRF